ncbi:MAG: hypothetical protein SF123_10885 [Chloroflexota bacterium]|nr:hypothetical protein [Chloroflexota bacterium]
MTAIAAQTAILSEMLEELRRRPAVVERVESGNYQLSTPPAPVPAQVTLELSERQHLSPKLELVLKHLTSEAGKADMGMSGRDLGEKLGVSHVWVNKAKAMIKSGEYKP